MNYPGSSLPMHVVVRVALLTIADAIGVPSHQLLLRQRGSRQVAAARSMAMALCHTVAGRSFSDIAAAFGRDRSTASHHAEMVEWLCDVAEIEAFLDLAGERMALALQLFELPSGRESWRLALEAVSRDLDAGALECEAVDAAAYVERTFGVRRVRA